MAVHLDVTVDDDRLQEAVDRVRLALRDAAYAGINEALIAAGAEPLPPLAPATPEPNPD